MNLFEAWKHPMKLTRDISFYDGSNTMKYKYTNGYARKMQTMIMMEN